MPSPHCPNVPGEECLRESGATCPLSAQGVCDNVIIQRAKFLNALAVEYANTRNETGSRPPVSVNESAVFVATKSIVDDIYRYRMYHLPDPRTRLADAVKLSAYTVKWLCRVRILENLPPSSDGASHFDDISGLLVNVEFSLFMARTYIGAELKQVFFFKPHYEDEFVYDLFYREITADGLLHIFQNIFSAVKIRRAGILEFPEHRTRK